MFTFQQTRKWSAIFLLAICFEVYAEPQGTQPKSSFEQELADFVAESRRLSDLLSQDKVLAENSVTRVQRISELRMDLLIGKKVKRSIADFTLDSLKEIDTTGEWLADYMDAQKELAYAMERLGRIGGIEVVDDIIDNIGLRLELRGSFGGYTSPLSGEFSSNPATLALGKIGKQVFPRLIDRIASQPTLPDWDRQTRNSLDGYGLLFIGRTIKAGTNQPTRNILTEYAQEYKNKSERLQLLAGVPSDKITVESKLTSLPGLPTEAETPKTWSDEEKKTEIKRFARVLELEAVLVDEKIEEKDEAKVVAALEELGQMKSVRSVPLIADKLDPSWQPEPPDDLFPATPMAADPKGLRTEPIARAAKAALVVIGQEGIPLLLDSMVSSGRMNRFRKDGMAILHELTGDAEKSKALLLEAATLNAWKAKRLIDLGETLPRVGRDAG
jgi:hypothetical protein